MASSVTHKLDLSVVQYMFYSPQGALAKDMMKRGERVVRRAKRNLAGGGGTGPRRIDTGNLQRSIKAKLELHPGGQGVRVGTNARHARYVHDGTGIYGPKRQVIRPKRAKALVFRSKTYGQKSGSFRGFVVVKSVKGMKPNPFLREALPAFKN